MVFAMTDTLIECCATVFQVTKYNQQHKNIAMIKIILKNLEKMGTRIKRIKWKKDGIKWNF
jgi:hypothetical protein